LEIEGNSGKYSYYLEILHDIGKHITIVTNEILHFNNEPLFVYKNDKLHVYNDNNKEIAGVPLYLSIGNLKDGLDVKKITWFKEYISKFTIVKMQPQLMTSDSPSEERSPSNNMSNFSSWYRFLSQEYQGQIIELTKELKEVIPGFHSFALSQAGDKHKILKVGYSGEADSDSIKYYKFDELSDGQKVLFVLYTLLFGIRKLGYSLFLDEPENFLALPEIQPWLMAVSDTCGESFRQIVLISHHPELINYFGASAGIWFERNANGPVEIKENIYDGKPGLRLSETIARGWTE